MLWVSRGSSIRFRLICVWMFVANHFSFVSAFLYLRTLCTAYHSFLFMLTLFGFEPVSFLGYVIIGLSVFCFVYGTITHNVSQVDRLWSIYPLILGWIYSYESSFSPVVLLMTVCITLWGCRLTYNFYIKGGFTFKNGVFTDEDYRWGILRRCITNPFLWNLFHICFICLFQITLITGMTSPILLVAMQKPSITPIDYGFAAVFIFFLLIETVADADMFRFQTAKYALSPEDRLKSDDPRIVAGFNFTGLYKYSRHPNYFAEVMQWVVIYLWGSYHVGTWKNWGLIFVIVLFIIVFSSTFVVEAESRSKYPLYELYQKGTSRFFPLFCVGYSRFLEAVEKRRK